MNSQNKKFVDYIQSLNHALLDHQIDLVTLQSSLDAATAGYDGIDQELYKVVYNFVEDLELIRYMYSKGDQFDQISKEIAKLKSALASFSS